ncbi:hypothetical protein BLNAU_5442 [Blattamonas nauphoetae]|uniref:PPPDE domain-containing protein n=1 Tax=Blattamonas nauphoetae TaxID=2049346 RepID=A0ABQ9Y7B2_9EUKA|nr:hypothetical protein BLNAU_5442 [Blattamonas nauphoetae]
MATTFILVQLLSIFAHMTQIDEFLSKITPGCTASIILGSKAVWQWAHKPKLAHLVSAVHTCVHIHPATVDDLAGDIMGITFEYRPEGCFIFCEDYKTFVGHTYQRSGHTPIRTDISGLDIGHFVSGLSRERFTSKTYNVRHNNCQTFALEMFLYLTRRPGQWKIIPFNVLQTTAGRGKVIFTIIFLGVIPVTIALCMVVGMCLWPLYQKLRSYLEKGKWPRMSLKQVEEMGAPDDVCLTSTKGLINFLSPPEDQEQLTLDQGTSCMPAHDDILESVSPAPTYNE